MYPDGYGETFLSRLEKVETTYELIAMLALFSQNAHGYPVEEVSTLHPQTFNGHSIIFTDDNYFEEYFSDWTFWKNATSNPVLFRTRDGESLQLLPGRTLAFSFGNMDSAYSAIPSPHFQTASLLLSRAPVLA